MSIFDISAVSVLNDVAKNGNPGVASNVNSTSSNVLTNIIQTAGSVLTNIFGGKSNQVPGGSSVTVTSSGPQTSSGGSTILSFAANKTVWIVGIGLVVFLLFGKVIFRTIKRVLR